MNWFKKFTDKMIAVARAEEQGKQAQEAKPTYEMSTEQRERMASVQLQAFYSIGGTPYVRVTYGGEKEGIEDEFKRCVGCGVKPGELHMPSCTREQCPACGGRAFVCGCKYGS